MGGSAAGIATPPSHPNRVLPVRPVQSRPWCCRRYVLGVTPRRWRNTTENRCEFGKAQRSAITAMGKSDAVSKSCARTSWVR